jgi:A/G-specific adenine glycosylase
MTMSFPTIGPSLLAWYDRHRRNLPWRAGAGETPDPYRVWLSEIMLQQTTVTAAIPYFERFVSRFPTVEALAAASLDDVLTAWAGLGYYARARNLHACAGVVLAAGGFPKDPERLRALPGIGRYTATAIAAIAFGRPGVPVDGNVERVLARVLAITEPLPPAKAAIGAAAVRLAEEPEATARPADLAQALFDLGATICTPASPACGICPLMTGCAGRRAGIAEELPRRPAKSVRPVRYGVHFWLTDAEGRVLLRRRPASGLLGGMMELPGTDWRAIPWGEQEALALAPMPASWRAAGEVRHGFTHFELRIGLLAAGVGRIEADGMAEPVTGLDRLALSSLMRKCVRQAGAVLPTQDGRPTSVPSGVKVGSRSRATARSVPVRPGP